MSRIGRILEKCTNENSLYDKENSEINKIIEDSIKNAITKVEDTYELFSVETDKVEDKSRDGFMAFTEGGYEGKGFQTLSYLNGSGNLPISAKAGKEIQAQLEYNRELAIDQFKEKNEKKLKDLKITDKQLNYSDLYDLGQGALAEELDGIENDYNSEGTIMFQIGAYFYEPKGEEKNGTVYVFGVVNWESPYHRSGRSREDVVYKEDLEFSSPEDLKKKLEVVLGIIVEKL